MVSDRIKALRVAAGMTQEQLGEVLGVGKATVQKYESGQIQNLKTAHIRTLCRLFNKRPHYFIFDDLNGYENDSGSLLEKVEAAYGETLARVLKKGLMLNADGQRRLLQSAADLIEIDKYKK